MTLTADTGTLEELARAFCADSPHRDLPFAKRNWGGTLHSLCSYHGKLKPSIAHFLVANFTDVGDRVLDPLGGVGTIPLEARRQGRVGIANDLSPVAAAVSAAKLLPADPGSVHAALADLSEHLRQGPDLDALTSAHDVAFGLNGPIRDYFHSDTLREVLLAREWFGRHSVLDSPAHALLMTCLLHILHGNRPYALSRRSHPITPFRPSGPTEYRALIGRLQNRLQAVLPLLADLDGATLPGEVHRRDVLDLDIAPVDAVITSPPFAESVRFWSMNWLRLWFAGWQPADFTREPQRYLEHKQRTTLDVYGAFAERAHEWLRPGGRLILHLGETSRTNMSDAIIPLLHAAGFDVAHVGRECVRATESHGLTDKGATVAHWYVFATRA